MKQQAKGNIMLLITAMIWGVAFVAQSKGMEHVGPFTFLSVRSVIGGAVLIPVILIFNALNKRGGEKKAPENKKTLIIGGISCGTALCAASCFQQAGISMDASAGDAGFITALYILIVPIIRLFFGKRAGLRTWCSVAVALFGFYLLTEKFGGFTKGSLMVLISAVLFAVHILVIDYFSPKADGVKLSCIQFFTCAAISGVLMLIFEQPSWENMWDARIAILYAGALSSGVGYTLQVVAQKYTKPTSASMIMSLESVFALIAGMLIQPEENPVKLIKIAGCVLIFAAIVLVQLPEKRMKNV